MLILPRYNDIFGYFTAISLYRESRYNDLIPLLFWHIVISGFHCGMSSYVTRMLPSSVNGTTGEEILDKRITSTHSAIFFFSFFILD